MYSGMHQWQRMDKLVLKLSTTKSWCMLGCNCMHDSASTIRASWHTKALDRCNRLFACKTPLKKLGLSLGWEDTEALISGEVLNVLNLHGAGTVKAA